MVRRRTSGRKTGQPPVDLRPNQPTRAEQTPREFQVLAEIIVPVETRSGSCGVHNAQSNHGLSVPLPTLAVLRFAVNDRMGIEPDNPPASQQVLRLIGRHFATRQELPLITARPCPGPVSKIATICSLGRIRAVDLRRFILCLQENHALHLVRLRIIAFAVFTLIHTASAQQFPSVDGRRQDLDFVANQLPALHPNFFAHISRESYQQAVSELDAKLSTATDAQFYVGIAQLVAMAGDGHALNYSSAPFRLFPIRLRWFDDGIFVTRAAAPYTEALTARFVRIADTPIGSAIDRLAAVIPHENDYWLHYLLPNFIINQTILQGLGLAPDAMATSLTFQTLGGREFTLEVGTSSAPLITAVSESDGSIPLYQQNASDNYWYSYLASDRVLYFRYNSAVEMAARSFTSFAADLLATLDANPVDTLVFDLRFNTGGNSGLIAPVFNGLAARFSRLTANRRFQIYDVFNEGTFSSGLMNAEDLLTSYPRSIPNPNVAVDLSARVVSIGQPTGGKPTHYGNVAALILPGSSIAGQRSTTLWKAPPGFRTPSACTRRFQSRCVRRTTSGVSIP